jgi:hypothetical protein
MSEHAGTRGPAEEPPDQAGLERRTIMVFIRDLERDLGTGYKTTGGWRGGVFDDAPWREGELRCDCVRGLLLYGSGTFPCGSSRFTIERIVTWNAGETVYSERGLT